MIYPYDNDIMKGFWGRLVIGIGRGDAEEEFEKIIQEVSTDQFDLGVKHEINRRTQEIANKLMGNQRMCSRCNKAYTATSHEIGMNLDPHICNECIPF